MKIKINKIELSYEKFGSGQAIIMLHGNGENKNIFRILARNLSRKFTVYTIDSRGHGKSTPIEHYNYQDMVDDLKTFINKLKITQPIVLGFSDGGIVGLMLAIQNQSILKKLIVCGANTNPKAIKFHYRFLFGFNYFFTRNKLVKLMLTQPNISKEELENIKVPTLVIAGQKDLIKQKNIQFISKAIKNSQIKIIEGENHLSYVHDNNKLYQVIKDFLN